MFADEWVQVLSPSREEIAFSFLKVRVSAEKMLRRKIKRELSSLCGLQGAVYRRNDAAGTGDLRLVMLTDKPSIYDLFDFGAIIHKMVASGVRIEM